MGTKRCVRTRMLVLLCVVLAGGWSPTGARTIYVDDDAPAPGDGASWATAFKYLQDALAVVKGPDEIHVAQGIYRPGQSITGTSDCPLATFRLVNGVAIRGGFAGLSGADPDLRDPARFVTTLDGDLGGNDGDPNVGDWWDDNSRHIITALSVGTGTVLDGLLLTRGYAYEEYDAPLYLEAGSLVVRDCTFRDNYAERGDGAVYSYHGDLRIEHCRFLRNGGHEGSGTLRNREGSLEVIASEFIENGGEEATVVVDNEKGQAVLFGCLFRANHTDRRGTVWNSGTLSLLYCTLVDNDGCCGVGALECADGSATVVHCLFYRNRANRVGAFSLSGGSVALEQCTFYNNAGTGSSVGAIRCLPAAALMARGCILWANCIEIHKKDGWESQSGYETQVSAAPNTATFDYSCIEGWTPDRGGIGNIGTDPLFVAPDQNDFHLKSQAGHWDAAALAWVADDITSPCIDAGDPNAPVGYEPFPNGGRVNLGVYGGTGEASKSWFGTEPAAALNAADLNGDGRVDDEDYRLALLRWPPMDE